MNQLLNTLQRSMIYQIRSKAIQQILKVNDCVNLAAAQRNIMCAGSGNWQQKTSTTGGAGSKTTVVGGAAQKKTKSSPKITLVAQNQSLSVTTLEEAQKLAKRRDLHLIQVETLDTKTQRSTYKLVTAAEMLAEELDDSKSNASEKEKSHKKSEKSLTIGSRITDHDLGSRLKNITKWLGKQHEIRILIQGSVNEMHNCEKIAKTIEQSIKEPQVIGKIVQKRSKGAVVKFNIIPVMPITTPTATEATANSISNVAEKQA